METVLLIIGGMVAAWLIIYICWVGVEIRHQQNARRVNDRLRRYTRP